MRNLIMGISFLTFFALPAHSTVLDCNSQNIKNTNDIYVCMKPELRLLNQQLNKLSEIKPNSQNGDAQILDSWLYRRQEERNLCHNEQCLLDNYNKALADLRKYQNGETCRKVTIPPECEIYYYNKDNPRTLSEIQLSDQQNTYKDKITINLPGKCVYLFVSAYYPAVWDIVASKDTRLGAIIASGDQPQMVIGYPEKTIIINHNQNELLQNSKSCFNMYYREKDVILKKFADLGIAPERVNFVNENQIGNNTEISNYLYNPEQKNGEEVKVELYPEEKGWQQLLMAGKVRKVNAQDIKKIKQVGLINLDNSEFMWDRTKYTPLFEYENSLLRDGYIVLNEFERIPNERGGSRNILFFPEDIKTPENLDAIPSFAGLDKVQMGTNMIFMIKTSAEEVRKW